MCWRDPPIATWWPGPTVPEDDPGPASRAERVRGYVTRARRAPGAIGDVAHDMTAARDAVGDLGVALARVEELVWAARHDTRGGVTAVGDELHALDRHLARVAVGFERIDEAIVAQAAALHRAVAAPARAAAARALTDALGPSPPLAPGLSVFTPSWNHAELLPDAMRSAGAVLDLLAPDEQGEIVILDDASVDGTTTVAAALATEDPRIRVVRSEVNLGLTQARNVLLHRARTTHAFQLDADNVALPEGVATLYEAARSTGATLTYGTIVQVDRHGTALGPIANEPPSPALFRANYIDAMSLVDLAAARALGGWSTDPVVEHVEDWVMVRRVMAAGRLIAFVPTLVGHYRVLDSGLYRSVSDPRIGSQRVGRTFDPTGRRLADGTLDGVAAVAVHPATGPLWATPEAVALRPDLAPRPAGAMTTAARRRVLVVAPGGVANLGDDAITVRGLDRVADLWGDEIAVDLVTDGPDLPPGRTAARWLGSLIDVLPGLDRAALGPLDERHEVAATLTQVGKGRWRPLDPGAYEAAVFLGGGSLQSLWSDGLIAPRAVLGAALRRAGVRYACSGQGIGPLDGPADGALVGGLLAGAVAVACRDEASADIARAIVGVDPATVVVTGDDALGLAPDPARPRGSGRNRPVLAVTVRRADYVGGDAEDPVRRWARAADDLAAGRGWDVVGVALNAQAPEPEIATLARIRATTPLRTRWHLVECGADPRRLAAEVAAADAVAAQSFHAALLAVDAGVPAVLAAATPYYRAKARGLAAAAGLPAALAVTDPAALGSSLDAVSAAIEDRAAPLAEASAAVDAWWAALPVRLALPAAASATG